MNVSRAQQRPSSVWCLLQQPPDPTTQQPTQPVPSPWTPGQGHPKTAHLPLEGPAWALPTLPPPPPCFWEPTPSPPIWKVDTAWSRHSACMLGVRGWRGMAASPTLWPYRPGRGISLAPRGGTQGRTSSATHSSPQPGGSLCRGACGGHRRATWVGVCGCWMPEPGSGPGSAGQSPCPLRGRARPWVRQTALDLPVQGLVGAGRPSSKPAHLNPVSLCGEQGHPRALHSGQEEQ